MAQTQRLLNLYAISSSHLSRRCFVSGLSLAGCGLLGIPRTEAQSPATNSGSRSGLLMQPAGVTQLATRTKIAMELTGHLRIQEPQAGQAAEKGIEVRAKSTLDYLEKIALAEDAGTQLAQPVAAARRYFVADVENWIGGKTSESKLRPACAETRLLPHQGVWQQYCETYPLDAREVQLLQSPINSAALELLLPLQPAKADSTWIVRAQDAKQLFNLDAVHKSTLAAKITKVEKGVATIELQGVLEATANSVPTHLEINGNLQVSVASSTAIVTWLGLVVKERRQLSQAEPGFDISARVRLIRQADDTHLPVSQSDLLELAHREDEGRWLVRLHSTAGHYSMLADRRWHIHRDSSEEAILRMVENNTIIAQCAVSRLSELEAGQQLTMEGLQADIKKSLGNTFREFLESNEKVTGTQLRMLRTTVSGVVEDVPIQWIYTHLSDDSGRRLALVYTMGGNVTDRFGAADEQMAMSFEWLPDVTANEGEKSPKSPATPPALTAEKAPVKRLK